ncbi:4-hydroxythreonine-4-phosphate dehydrogenase PdxA, partial [Fibrobacterota bacterium]
MHDILITLGDAAGVGPEIIVKLLSGLDVGQRLRNLVIGEQWILEETASRLNCDLKFCSGNSSDDRSVKVESLNLLQPGDFNIGRLSKKCGDAAYAYFFHAVEACLADKARGIVTAPLNKEAMNRAGHPFIGHTEILEKMTGQSVVMSLVHPRVFVSHVTDHLPLKKALEAVTPKRIVEVVQLTW